jgi:hypothetical protein
MRGRLLAEWRGTGSPVVRLRGDLGAVVVELLAVEISFEMF